MTGSASVSPVPAHGKPATVALRTWLYAIAIILHLVFRLAHLTWMAPLLSVLSLAAILVSLPACAWGARLLTVLFVGAGSGMLVRQGIDWRSYLEAHGSMLYLLALFAMVPFLSVPVKLGGYSGAIQALLQGRIASVFALNCLATTLSFICASFMSMAALPVMMSSMEAVVERYPIADKMRFMTVSSTYGYVLPILWTPVSGVVGVVLHSLRLDWLSMFPILFGLSIVGLVMGWGLFYLLEMRGKPAALPSGGQPAQTAAPLARLLQMVAAIVLLVACIGLLDGWLHIGLVTIVPLVALPFALAWSAAIGQGRQALREAGRQTMYRLPAMADQFAIFLSAGFFASAMQLSGFDDTVNLMFLHLRDALGAQGLLILMPLMALIASFLGIHPLVAIALLGESLKPEVLGISSARLAVALVGSSVLTYMLGPFSGTLGLLQALSRVPSFRLSLWNAPYAFGYFVLLVAAILLIH